MNFLLTFSSSSGCTFSGSITRSQTFSQPMILSLTPCVFPVLTSLTLLYAVYCQICSQGSSLSPNFHPLFSMVDWHFKRYDFLAANFTMSVNQYITPLHLLPLTQQLILTSILQLMTAYWAGNFSIILSISFFLFQMHYLPRANESVFTISLTSFHIFPQPLSPFTITYTQELSSMNGVSTARHRWHVKVKGESSLGGNIIDCQLCPSREGQ